MIADFLKGTYVIAQTQTGVKVRVVDRRIIHPKTGKRCLLCGGIPYPLEHCKPLGWLPCKGLKVRIVNMPWQDFNYCEGEIIKTGFLKAMPIAYVSIPERKILEAQLTWITPLSDLEVML
jgi:hypothetical protein